MIFKDGFLNLKTHLVLKILCVQRYIVEASARGLEQEQGPVGVVVVLDDGSQKSLEVRAQAQEQEYEWAYL